MNCTSLVSLTTYILFLKNYACMHMPWFIGAKKVFNFLCIIWPYSNYLQNLGNNIYHKKYVKYIVTKINQKRYIAWPFAHYEMMILWRVFLEFKPKNLTLSKIVPFLHLGTKKHTYMIGSGRAELGVPAVPRYPHLLGVL